MEEGKKMSDVIRGEVDINNIYLSQEDLNFDETRAVELDSLISSIKAEGLIHPILVAYNPTEKGEYELITGRRRLKAYKSLYEQYGEQYATIPATIYATQKSSITKLLLKITENKERINVTANEQFLLLNNLMQEYQKIMQIQKDRLSISDKDIETAFEEIIRELGINFDGFKHIKKLVTSINKIQEQDPELSDIAKEHLNTFKDVSKTQKYLKKISDGELGLEVTDVENNKPVFKLQNHGLSPVVDEFLSLNSKYTIINTLKDMISYLPWDLQNDLIKTWGTANDGEGKQVISPLFLCKVSHLEDAYKSRYPESLFNTWRNIKSYQELYNIINTAIRYVDANNNRQWILYNRVNDVMQMIERTIKSTSHEIKQTDKIEFCVAIINIVLFYLSDLLDKLFKSSEGVQLTISDNLSGRLNNLKGSIKQLNEIKEMLLSKDYHELYNLEGGGEGVRDREDHINILSYSKKEQLETQLQNIRKLINDDQEENEDEDKVLTDKELLNKILQHIVKFNDDEQVLMDENVNVSVQKIQKTFEWWYNQAILSKKAKNREKIFKALYDLLASMKIILSSNNVK